MLVATYSSGKCRIIHNRKGPPGPPPADRGMDVKQLGRGLIFLAGALVGGLALAFLIVLAQPQLLNRIRPAATLAAATAAPANGAAGSGNAAAVPAAAEPAVAMAPLPGAATPATETFARAVARASPAVVNIYTARVVSERVAPPEFELFFGDAWPSYQQRVQRALGSGVIVDAAGHVITNNHVIAGAATIQVQLADGRETRATVVGRDPDTDLAVLTIKLDRLPVMPLGDSDRAHVGDIVLAMGNPLGLQQTVTHGIISATGRSQLGVATFENFIQTDAAINEGNSGGALVNVAGELVGINTAVLSKTAGDAGVEGIGFAIPVNLVRGVMKEILAHGKVSRGWVGLIAEDFGNEAAQQAGLARGGVVVTRMYRNSPAVAAGIQPGDLILAIDGQAVRSAQEVTTRLALRKPGASVKLRIQRGRQTAEVESKVAERPTTLN
jgi:serine protease DegS